jgi:hypothetical protein
MTSSSALAINEGAPIWALDPTTHAEHLTDYDLMIANATFTDAGLGSSYASVSGWYQVWVGPKGCNATASCTSIIALSYIEISIEYPDLAIGLMKSLFQSYLNFTDITSEVPNAVAAFMYNLSGFYMGFAVFNDRKRILSVVQLSFIPFMSSGGGGSSIQLSSAGATATKDLMIAAGNAAGAVAIPGYDLIAIMGVTSVIATGIIIRKKKKL